MDEMTPFERIDAALTLKPVDRAPIIPLMDLVSSRLQGVKPAQLVVNMDLAREVMIKTFEDLGGWDATFFPGGIVNEIGWSMFGMPSKLPGFDLPDDEVWQLDEKEIMKVEDYDFIVKNGWNAYLGYVYPRLGMRPAPACWAMIIVATGSVSASPSNNKRLVLVFMFLPPH